MPFTHSKSIAIKSFIVTWLKDPTVYCNNCGDDFNAAFWPCCDKPQKGTNKVYLAELVRQNQEQQKQQANDYAANNDMTMRWGVSMLPRLLQDLEMFFEKNYHEKLWNNDKELKQFMKDFPMFRICRKV